MRLKTLKINGFKSFGKPIVLEFPKSISAIVGPNGSGKSNAAEAIAWVLGEQSLKSLRGKRGEDLIFNGSSSVSRMARASVILTFLNQETGDEISVSRVVFRDGSNKYYIGDELKRLKDVVDFLSQIGTSTLKHHIISQGEADKFLNTSPSERKGMIEDALGLRIYQLRKAGGERKLVRTEENISQVESLRREIQPHLRFLKKQVERANETTSLKEKLADVSFRYFSNLKHRLEKELDETVSQKRDLIKESGRLEKEAGEMRDKIGAFKEQKEKSLLLRSKISELEREVGRYEAMLEQAKKVFNPPTSGEKKIIFDFAGTKSFIDFLSKKIEIALREKDIEEIKKILLELKNRASKFCMEAEDDEVSVIPRGDNMKEIEKKHEDLLVILNDVKNQENKTQKEMEEGISLERGFYKKEIEISGIKNRLELFNAKESAVKIRMDEMKRDCAEAEAVLGSMFKAPDENADIIIGDFDFDKSRRELERLEIKIEESGSVGGEMVKEYGEIKRRDEFLVGEIADLEKTAVFLEDLIKELEGKLEDDFKTGLAKINKEFSGFFEAMFGGGSATLKIKSQILNRKSKKDDEAGEEEDLLDEIPQEAEAGLNVSVHLPKKRITSLEMLSGGERALTSIALLFAVSQVNPPPFLILDETDAALDESNSRKYGKMLKDLSRNTQLLLITHNRETMAVADILYGVTMGNDGVSRLLSIKLGEAEEYAY